MSKNVVGYTAHVQSGLLLNANEASRNPSDEIMEEVLEAVKTAAFNRYPDNDETELLEAYAAAFGLESSQLLAGNGSDQMLGFIIASYLGKGKTLYTYNPDFSMYDYYASSYEAGVEKYVINDDGSFDLEAFIANGKEKNVDLVMFSNPNNPSGHLLNKEEIDRILKAFSDIPVIVDEAYIEFTGMDSMVYEVENYENLFVTRTLSKAFGLAGLRIGFLVSSKKNMAKLKPAAVPYALNTLSMKVGAVVLSHAEEILAGVGKIVEERERVWNTVKNYESMRFYPSKANFIYGMCDQKEELLKLFEEKNIVIRNYAGKNSFRITIGLPEENNAVLEVLKSFEEKQV